MVAIYVRLASAMLTALVAAALLAPPPARAQGPPPPPPPPPLPGEMVLPAPAAVEPPPAVVPLLPRDDRPGGGPSDLTLENFFTAGWCEQFQHRPTAGQAERIILFRTLGPFLDREARLNYQFGLHTRPTRVNENELGGEALLPVNRRLMFDVEFAYDFNGDDLPGTGGANGAITSVLQLIDTQTSALNVQASFNVPGRDDLLEHRLEFGLGVAGFQDLGRRFGLQGSFGIDFPVGSSEFGSDVALSYAVALTKTLTDDVPWIGHFTPFVELAGTTDLGVDQRRTVFTVLPGAEWEFLREWWVAVGVEVPLTGPRHFDLGVHFSLVRSF